MCLLRVLLVLLAAACILAGKRELALPAATQDHNKKYRRAQAESAHRTILPNLHGFGTTTVAGSGRHLTPSRSQIIRVRTLSDSGPGSLRECINLRGPRTCLFEVSGAINLRSILRIRSPYITIAGQSAPKPGITLTHGGISIETHDVLIQHIAVRPGDSTNGVSPRARDGVSIGAPPPGSAYNVVLDHLSVTWAIDENISTAYPGTHDITIANSLIAEGLHRSIHPKGPHSKGVMIGNNSQRITLYRNIIALNEERNPYIKPGASVEMINNVVYGWGANGGWSLCNLSNNDGIAEPVQLSFIGNFYIAGPWSFIAPPIYAKVLSPASRIYVEGNSLVAPGLQYAELPPTTPWAIAALDEEAFRADVPPVSSNRAETLSSAAAYSRLLTEVGSRPRNRSRIDQRILADIQQRRGGIKDCLTGCINAANPEPSALGRTRNLRLPRSPHADRNNDGYTDLENWLHRMQP